MPIAMQCSFCGSMYEAPDTFAGAYINCPNCGQADFVAGAADAQPVQQPIPQMASPAYVPAAQVAPAAGGGKRRMLRPHRGGTVLALGILGIVACAVCAPIAWSMGNTDLMLMSRGIMDPSGRSITEAGKICGMVGTILAGISIVVLAFYLLMIGLAS